MKVQKTILFQKKGSINIYLLNLFFIICLFSFTDINAQITSVTIEGIGSQSNVPITFGLPLKKGDLPSGSTLYAKNASGATVNIQVDRKAKFRDGSWRHVVVSGILKNSTDNKLKLYKKSGSGSSSSENTSTLSNTGLNVNVKLTIGGTTYNANLSGSGFNSPTKTWLSGGIMNEWEYLVPLKKSSGQKHQQLVAHINVRKYKNSSNTRVDVSIENGFTFVANPGNITYNAQIKINGNTVYSKNNLRHNHRSRWRKVFWSQNDSNVHIKHNTDYLIKTKAVPNYDQSLSFSSNNIQSYYNNWKNTNTEPMGIGPLNPNMGATGGRPDIGPLAGWDARYVLTMSKKEKEIVLTMGDLSGSWPIFYKDKNTNKPVSIETYPQVSTHSNARYKGPTPLPNCNNCDNTGLNWDIAHQSAFAYLPYLITGDKYYLESLQYWANSNLIGTPPGVRDQSKGSLKDSQVRGQAWAMRTLGRAYAFSPEGDPLKAYFKRKIDYNLSIYKTHLIDDTKNKLGINTLGYVFNYYGDGSGATHSTGANRAIASWQDAFFTWSISHLVELDIHEAQPLFVWKSKFIKEMMTSPDYCWQVASLYSITVRPNDSRNQAYHDFDTGTRVDYRLYQNFKDVYKASVPYAVSSATCGTQGIVNGYANTPDAIRKVNDMIGYPDSPEGFPSNMQPALAAIVDYLGKSKGDPIWNKFESRTTKPNYTSGDAGPIWAIIPRGNVTVTPPPTDPPVDPPTSGGGTIDVRVASSTDDAEEGATGYLNLRSSDLELVYDKSNQKVGMRFKGIAIPKGATITNAYIQFKADEKNSGGTTLTIKGEDTNNAATFVKKRYNISRRTMTSASASWSPSAWKSVREAGAKQRTSNLKTIVQEIVNRSGWNSGNAIVMVITGSGERTAESYNGDASGAPLLHVEFDGSSGGGGSDTEAPNVPGNLYVSNTTSSGTTLHWNPSWDNEAIANYDVYQNNSKIATVTGTVYTVSGLSSGTSYSFKIRSRDTSGNVSGFSNTANITTSGSGGDTEAPSVPGNLYVSNTTSSGTTLHWNPSWDNETVANYDVYQNNSKIATVTGTVYTVSGLSSGTSYSFKIRSRDTSGNVSGFSNTANITTSGSGGGGGGSANYCTSSGTTNSGDNYLYAVTLNTISNYSGTGSGYSDFTNMSTNIYTSQSNNLIVRRSWDASYTTVGIAVYIDYNHDNDFSDANELVYSKVSATDYNASGFTAPATAKSGTTRVRVVMKKGWAIPGPCENFYNGEVEDYTVNIVGGVSKTGSKKGAIIENEILVYPNPSSGTFYINIPEYQSARINVISNLGSLIYSKEAQAEQTRIDLGTVVTKGVYTISITTATQTTHHQVMVK